MVKMSNTADWMPEFEIADVETLKVLAHPQRLAMLRNLDEPRTVKEVAARMDEADPTKLYYHIRMMEKAGIIVVTETNVVSGIIEKKYRAAAKSYTVADNLVFADAIESDELLNVAKSIFQNTEQQLQKTIKAGLFALDEPGERRTNALLTLEVNLSEAQLLAFNQRMQALMDDIASWNEEDKAGDAQTYMMTLAFFPTERSDG